MTDTTTQTEPRTIADAVIDAREMVAVALAERMRLAVNAAVSRLDFTTLAREAVGGADIGSLDSLHEEADRVLNEIEWAFNTLKSDGVQ